MAAPDWFAGLEKAAKAINRASTVTVDATEDKSKVSG